MNVSRDRFCCTSVSLGGALSSLLLQEYKTVGPKEVADQDELLQQQQKSVLIPVSVDSEFSETASENEAEIEVKNEIAKENIKVTENSEGTAKSKKSSGLTAVVKVVKNC